MALVWHKIVDSAYDLTSMMPIAVDKVKGLTQAVVDFSQQRS